MAQQRTMKRRKVTSGSVGDVQQETAITLASAVVADPLQHMVGFVDHSGRLNLALSCKSMHHTVEVYCKAALAKIEQDNHVDETFAERLRDPSRVCFTGGLQPVSDDLPYRYLLKAARFTHLYTLEMMKGSPSPSCASALSKDGGRLVVAATLMLNTGPQFGDRNNQPPLFVYAWDVTAEPGAKKIYEIPAGAQDYVIKDIFCMEELIVLCTNERILTLAFDTGDLKHAYTHPMGVYSVIWQGTTDNVVFLDDDDKVYSFHASTGTAQFLAQLTLHQQEYNRIAGLLNDRWLVVCSCSLEIHTGTNMDMGFRVFDLSNGCRQSCFFGGSFSAVKQSQTSGRFYTFDFMQSQCQVLQLSKQGEFSTVCSFALPSLSNETIWQEGLQSHWFFEKNRYSNSQGEETSMTVRCSKSGELQGSYKLPANCCRAYGMDIQWNGNKLFVGLAPKRGRDHGVCVAAFLAKEHF